MVPELLNRTNLSTYDFRDNLRLRFGLQTQGLRQTCNGCGEKLTVHHALKFKKVGLITIRHNNVAYEWGDLCASDLTPSAVSHEPLTNYGGLWTVTGETAVETEEDDTERRKEEESHGDNKNLTEAEK